MAHSSASSHVSPRGSSASISITDRFEATCQKKTVRKTIQNSKKRLMFLLITLCFRTWPFPGRLVHLGLCKDVNSGIHRHLWDFRSGVKEVVAVLHELAGKFDWIQPGLGISPTIIHGPWFPKHRGWEGQTNRKTKYVMVRSIATLLTSKLWFHGISFCHSCPHIFALC